MLKNWNFPVIYSHNGFEYIVSLKMSHCIDESNMRSLGWRPEIGKHLPSMYNSNLDRPYLDLNSIED